MEKYFRREKRLVIAIVLITVIISCMPTKVYALTEAEADFVESLCIQGYSYQVAWDEMFEVMKGRSGPYGTGGVDGIDPYSSGNTSSESSSSSSKTPAHVHSWTESVTKEASCKETGIMTLTCSCGESKEDVIPLTEHTYEVESEAPATCISYRSVTYKCAVCEDDYTIEFEEEGYGDHNYIPMDDSILPTCEDSGATHYVCDACEDDYWEEIPAFGHTEDPEHEIVPATFWKDGMETVRCITCKEIIYEQVIPSKGGVFRYMIPAGGIVVIIAVAVLAGMKKKKRNDIE